MSASAIEDVGSQPFDFVQIYAAGVPCAGLTVVKGALEGMCPLELGQRSAYRESRTCYGAPVTLVEVIEIEPRIKGKVRVVHLEGDYCGLKEWVPKQRLSALWIEADAFCADERRALIAAGISC